MMHVTAANDWRKSFGIEDAQPRSFFASKAELNAPGMDASQGHVLRRAFDLLKLDGVFCAGNTPLVYFKVVKRIDLAEVASLHRTFWNHGGAPILVLVAPDQVHLYSGLVRPLPQTDPSGRIPALVDHKRNDFVVWESGAILFYLVKHYDPEYKLWSSDDDEQSNITEWLIYQVSGFGPYIGQAMWYPSPSSLFSSHVGSHFTTARRSPLRSIAMSTKLNAF